MENAPTPMNYQISGMLMLISGLFNLFISGIYVLGLVWLCIGVFWLIPMMMAVGEVIVGVLALAGVRVPGLQIVSALGVVNSLVLCNIWGAAFEGIAVVLQSQGDVKGYLEGH